MERTRLKDKLAYATILLGSFGLIAYAIYHIYYQKEPVQDDLGYWYGGYVYDFLFGEEPKPQDKFSGMSRYFGDILHYAILTIGEMMPHASWVDHQPMRMFQTKQELLETSWINKILSLFTSEPEAVILEPDYFPDIIYNVLDARKWSTANVVMVTLTTVLSLVYLWTLRVDVQKAQLAKKDRIIKSNQILATAYMCFTRKKYKAVKSNYRLKVNELKEQLKVKERDIVRYCEFVDIAAARMEEQHNSLHEAGKTIELLKWGKVVSTD